MAYGPAGTSAMYPVRYFIPPDAGTEILALAMDLAWTASVERRGGASTATLGMSDTR